MPRITYLPILVGLDADAYPDQHFSCDIDHRGKIVRPVRPSGPLGVEEKPVRRMAAVVLRLMLARVKSAQSWPLDRSYASDFDPIAPVLK